MMFLFLIVILIFWMHSSWPSHPPRQRHRYRIKTTPCPAARNRRKPAWVKEAIIRLKAESNLSCYKLAATFNQLYAAKQGVTVGKTFVAETVRAHAYEISQLRERWKRQRPKPMPRNTQWAMDMTGKGDQQGNLHSILGILDHGSRMALALLALRDRSSLTLLKWLIATMETYGKPKVIRTDNEACFTSKRFTLALRLLGIRHQRTQPGHPWQNGRVERLFGTLKEKLDQLEVPHFNSLQHALAEFQFWYNQIRPHQHLDGWTPRDAWQGRDPYLCIPKSVQFFSAWDGLLTGYDISR